MNDLRVGLVLGAGGVAGHAFHAGVLHALTEVAGWDPRRADVVVGTSAGSVIGTGLRSGIPASDLFARVVGEPVSAATEELLAALPERQEGHYPTVDGRWRPLPAAPRMLLRMARSPWRTRFGLVTAAALPEGRRDVASIGADIDLLLAGRPFGGDLWITTVDLADGQRVVFGRDEVGGTWTWGQAVAASCAIPGFFAPVHVAGRRLVDGGAHSSTNADLLVGRQLDVVVVLAPMASVRSAAFRGVDAPFRALHRLRLATEVAALRRTGTPVVVFQPTRADLAVMGLDAMDPTRGAPVAQRAFDSAAERLRTRPDLLPAGARVA